MKNRKRILAVMLISAAIAVGGCGLNTSQVTHSTDSSSDAVTVSEYKISEETVTNKQEENLSKTESKAETATLLDTSEMFSERELEQEADLSDAAYITLEDGKEVTIDNEGVYVIQGSATDSTIIVEADDTAKIQLVLDGVKIENSDSPAIYVKSADKVFVTTTGKENTLSVTGNFTADGDTNTDAVIYSKEDLTFNGTGTLSIKSTGNGISGKDDLKFTGGSYSVEAAEDAVEANDSIRISDGSFAIKAGKDALHSENSDDTSKGYVYISGGEFEIDATDDGIQATTILMIDGGSLDITASEGLEATFVQINDGTVKISATDDGINASSKSSSYETTIEINGGDVTIDMGSGDTDALDANGNLYINGGNVSITAQFAFDFDGEAKLTGGTVTVNGEEVTEITNSMMMGGGHGGGKMQGFNKENAPQMPEGFDGQNPPQMPEGGFDGQNTLQKPAGGFKGGINKGEQENNGNNGNN